MWDVVKYLRAYRAYISAPLGWGKALRFALLSAVATGFAVTAYSQTPPPVPNSIAAQMAAPWRHLPNPVSDQQFQQDASYCHQMGDMAPPGQGSFEITYDLTFLNCLRSKGYEPVLSTEGTTQSEAKPKAQGGAQGLSVEDRACITKAAGKLPKIATIEQSRVVPPTAGSRTA